VATADFVASTGFSQTISMSTTGAGAAFVYDLSTNSTVAVDSQATVRFVAGHAYDVAVVVTGVSSTVTTVGGLVEIASGSLAQAATLSLTTSSPLPAVAYPTGAAFPPSACGTPYFSSM